MNTDIIMLSDEALENVSGGTGLLGIDLGASAKVGVCADLSLGECSLAKLDLGVNLGLNLGLCL
jgi:hypothetical protein